MLTGTKSKVILLMHNQLDFIVSTGLSANKSNIKIISNGSQTNYSGVFVWFNRI